VYREIFGDAPAQMAYLFMTDHDDVHETWDPEGGENAVVLQPGVYPGPTLPLAVGPALYRMVEDHTSNRRFPVPCEYAVTLEPGDDPEEVTPDVDAAQGNKVGGVPRFIQGREYPSGAPWRLLLQLDSVEVPFEVNFGDAGVGYAFLSADGTVAKFLWQCL